MSNKTPEGYDWGEGTKQTHPDYPDPDDKPPGWNNKQTDARDIRRKFGIAPFEDTWDFKPYPNCLVHEADGEKYGHVGGTNFLAIGEKGSGKSTLGHYWATRLMEVNNEAVVWRGSSSRSEWLPLKKWTTLLLPANAEIEPRWKPRDIREQNVGERADLDDVVREVKYYDDPIDLNDKLEPGKFHVVYPDPSFTGCDRIMRESDYMAQPTEHVPKSEADEPGDATPPIHWWFAYFVAKIEYGPYDWTSVIFDEVADLAPQSARADKHETYEKIEAMRRVMADSRKFYFSLFFFGHHEENLHSKVRRTIQWRISMPDGTSNPTASDSPPVGLNDIPMYHDLLSRRDVGHGICWTETDFSLFKWDDMPVFEEDERRWLKISTESGCVRARSGEEGEPRGVADD